MDGFMINPEHVKDVGIAINNNVKEILSLLENITGELSKLDVWQSARKDEYVNKVRVAIDNMKKVAVSSGSFGNVAQFASERILAAEREIQSKMGE